MNVSGYSFSLYNIVVAYSGVFATGSNIYDETFLKNR